MKWGAVFEENKIAMADILGPQIRSMLTAVALAYLEVQLAAYWGNMIQDWRSVAEALDGGVGGDRMTRTPHVVPYSLAIPGTCLSNCWSWLLIS